jgi:uncharacterized membrane protein
MNWFYSKNGTPNGPLPEPAFRQLVATGIIQPEDLVWQEEFGPDWRAAGTVAGLPFPATRVVPATGASVFQSPTPNRQLMASARAGLRGLWGVAIGGTIIFGMIQFAMSALTAIPWAGLLFALISWLINGALGLGLTMFWLNLSRRREGEVGLLFQGFRRFGTAFLSAFLIQMTIWLWLLLGLVLAGATWAVGALLWRGLPHPGRMETGQLFQEVFRSGSLLCASFLIQALLVLLVFLLFLPVLLAALRLSQTWYILADNPRMDALEAVRHSRQMMRGNTWKFICLQGRFAGWALLSLLTCGIGLLWLIPYLCMVNAKFYDDLRIADDARPHAAPDSSAAGHPGAPGAAG